MIIMNQVTVFADIGDKVASALDGNNTSLQQLGMEAYIEQVEGLNNTLLNREVMGLAEYARQATIEDYKTKHYRYLIKNLKQYLSRQRAAGYEVEADKMEYLRDNYTDLSEHRAQLEAARAETGQNLSNDSNPTVVVGPTEDPDQAFTEKAEVKTETEATNTPDQAPRALEDGCRTKKCCCKRSRSSINNQ